MSTTHLYTVTITVDDHAAPPGGDPAAYALDRLTAAVAALDEGATATVEPHDEAPYDITDSIYDRLYDAVAGAAWHDTPGPWAVVFDAVPDDVDDQFVFSDGPVTVYTFDGVAERFEFHEPRLRELLKEFVGSVGPRAALYVDLLNGRIDHDSAEGAVIHQRYHRDPIAALRPPATDALQYYQARVEDVCLQRAQPQRAPIPRASRCYPNGYRPDSAPGQRARTALPVGLDAGRRARPRRGSAP